MRLDLSLILVRQGNLANSETGKKGFKLSRKSINQLSECKSSKES